MVSIQPISELDERLLHELIVGYTTTVHYQVSRTETADSICFELRLLPLEQPFIKRYEPVGAVEVQQYQALAAQGHVFGAFDGSLCVGIAVTEPRLWHASLWVLEFHVASSYRGQGIGHHLMEAVLAHARANALRCVVCETQSKNVPAIRFYRSLGFALDGVDLSLYTDHDLERDEVAIFLKKWLAAEEPAPAASA